MSAMKILMVQAALILCTPAIFVLAFSPAHRIASQEKVIGKNISSKSATNAVANVIISKERALTFLRRKRSSCSMYRLKEECCDESCNNEEKEEMAECHSKEMVKEYMCQWQIREGRTCRCDGQACVTGYPDSSCNNCMFYTNTFYCHIGNKCAFLSNLCDSNNDCGNWKDEENCRITRKYNLQQIKQETLLKTKSCRDEGWSRSCSEWKSYGYCDPGSVYYYYMRTNCRETCGFCRYIKLYYGNVYVIGRPVCHHSWDNNDAKVVCRSLGFSEGTKAFGWSWNKWGSTVSDFRMDQVGCVGYEDNIGSCPHVTSSINCNANTAAGVTCVDPNSVRLENGVVYIMNLPVCADGWDNYDAKVVCKQLRHVSRFAAKSISSSGDTFSITNVRCTGNENNLAACSYDVHPQVCLSGMKAAVQCATCTPHDLLIILESVKSEGTTDVIYNSILNAEKTLKSHCQIWNCKVKSSQDYPEYCFVKYFLSDAKIYMQSKKNSIVYLETKFDFGRLLHINSMKQQLRNIRHDISKLSSGITTYFEGLASYDKLKSEADLSNLHKKWSDATNDIDEKESELKDQLQALFRVSFAIVGMEMTEDIAKMAIRIAGAANPIEWLVAPDENIINKINTARDIAVAAAKLPGLVHLLDKVMPRIENIVNKINSETRENYERYKNIKKMFQNSIPGKSFTAETSRQFLKEYETFTPIKQVDITEYFTALSVVVGTLCGVVENPHSVSGAVVSGVTMGIGRCPTTKVLVATMHTLLNGMSAVQHDVMDSMADIARARIAEEGARNIAKKRNLHLNEVEEKITAINGILLLRQHKLSLIERACVYVRYLNHGEQDSDCIRLMENPDSDPTPLISYIFNKDMCECATCGSREDIFSIPAVFSKGTDTLSKGTLDLLNLYNSSSEGTSGWTIFQIPDNEWLIQNGWITQTEALEGPFFLQSLELFFLPRNTSFRYSVETKMTLLENKQGSNSFLFEDGGYVTFRYDENNQQDCLKDDLRRSVYNVPQCPQLLSDVCVSNPGNLNGPLYPQLTASWKLTLKSPVQLPHLFISDNLFVKAKAKFCWKKSGKRGKRSRISYPRIKSAICCHDNKMFFNQTIFMKASGENPCKPCPIGSESRLNGYFCEKCPSGYEPRNAAFGCTPCTNGFFKKDSGPRKCVRCPRGLVTKGLGASQCVKKTLT